MPLPRQWPQKLWLASLGCVKQHPTVWKCCVDRPLSTRFLIKLMRACIAPEMPPVASSFRKLDRPPETRCAWRPRPWQDRRNVPWIKWIMNILKTLGNGARSYCGLVWQRLSIFAHKITGLSIAILWSLLTDASTKYVSLCISLSMPVDLLVARNNNRKSAAATCHQDDAMR